MDALIIPAGGLFIAIVIVAFMLLRTERTTSRMGNHSQHTGTSTTSNMTALKPYEGKWVALENEKVVASGDSPKEVKATPAEIRAYGEGTRAYENGEYITLDELLHELIHPHRPKQ